MTALLTLGIVALIMFSTTTVLVAVIYRRAASDAFRALERRDERAEKSLSTVLDRLMTIRWEDFATVKALEDNEEEGGFIVPEREAEVEIEEAGKWGHLSTLRDQIRRHEEEEEIIREDFPEEFTQP